MVRRPRRLRRLLLLLTLVGGAALWWRRSQRTASSTAGPEPSWPPLDVTPLAPAESGPIVEPDAPASGAPAPEPPAEADPPTSGAPEADPPEADRPTSGAPVLNGAAQDAAAAEWVPPFDGGCPDGYPVKVTRSGVFHVPGGFFYERATPARCYATAAAAEADGYRASKR